MDNMLGSLKYGIDGIAMAMGVDDCQFEFDLRRGEPRKGGAVVVEV